MVKIHDGSLVPASELLSNNAEDDEGNRLKFEQVKDAAYPTFEAKSKVPDDSGRKRTYRFSFDDTNVTVHMTITEPARGATAGGASAGKGGATAGDAKAGGDSATAGDAKAGGDNATAGESKKNSSAEPQQKLSPPDYRLRRSPT